MYKINIRITKNNYFILNFVDSSRDEERNVQVYLIYYFEYFTDLIILQLVYIYFYIFTCTHRVQPVSPKFPEKA